MISTRVSGVASRASTVARAGLALAVVPATKPDCQTRPAGSGWAGVAALDGVAHEVPPVVIQVNRRRRRPLSCHCPGGVGH